MAELAQRGTAGALTCLTRLARRRPKTRSLLGDALRARVDLLARSALDVAVETGDPIGRVLAGLLLTESSPLLARDLLELCDVEPYPAGTGRAKLVAKSAGVGVSSVH